MSLIVAFVVAMGSTSLQGHPGSSSAMGLGGFGTAGGVGNELAVHILSRLLAIDKGEAMSGVGVGEEIGKHPV